MQRPVLNLSLEEITNVIVETIEFLEDTLSRHPDLTWPAPLLLLVREFQTLAMAPDLKPESIHDFTLRLTRHMVSHRLKGLDDLIWHAEALERLAKNTPVGSLGAGANGGPVMCKMMWRKLIYFQNNSI